MTTPDKKDDPGLKALVEVLETEDTAKFIIEKYNGAVVPVTKVSELVPYISPHCNHIKTSLSTITIKQSFSPAITADVDFTCICR